MSEPDSHLRYMIDIALTAGFSLTVYAVGGSGIAGSPRAPGGLLAC